MVTSACSSTRKYLCQLLGSPNVDKMSTGRSKARPIWEGTCRCSVGARKLPYEENNAGGLVSRLPSPYNKVQQYMCSIIDTILHQLGWFIS